MGWEEEREERKKGWEEGEFQKRRGRVWRWREEAIAHLQIFCSPAKGSWATFLNLIIILICRKLVKHKEAKKQMIITRKKV